MVLVKLGLLTYDTMAKTRSYAIVAIFIAAAVITPTPDIMTLLLMALPMLFLYEICIWLAWLDRKKAREQEVMEEEEIKQRRLDWMLNNDEREQAAGTGDEDADGHADDGWHDQYGHHTDHYGHDDLEGHEDWIKPDDAVTGDAETEPDSEDDKKKDEGKPGE